MSYYFTKAYNWYWDVHPFRPTDKERHQKYLCCEQIKKSHFIFRKIDTHEEIPIIDTKDTLLNKLTMMRKKKFKQK